MKFGLDYAHGKSNRTANVYDPGAIMPGGTHEAVASRGMQNRIGADLKALGHTVVYTEGPLASRGARAKAAGVGFFLSTHFNGGKGTGVECFVDPAASSKAKAFAKDVCANISALLGIPNRGMKVNWFAVLRANPNDALLEVCFPADWKKYQDHVDGVEYTILNALLKANGYPRVTFLPRDKKPPVIDSDYIEVRVHAAKSDERKYQTLADTLGDHIVVKPAEKGSWKAWR